MVAYSLEYAPVGEIVPFGREAPNMFEVDGVKPGYKTINSLVDASLTNKTVSLTIFSTLAIDLRGLPLEAIIDRFHAVMENVENKTPDEKALLAFKQVSLSSVSASEATKIVMNRFKYCRTKPIGRCLVYVEVQSLTNWALELQAQDMSICDINPSHDLVVYRNGIQFIDPHGSRLHH